MMIMRVETSDGLTEWVNKLKEVVAGDYNQQGASWYFHPWDFIRIERMLKRWLDNPPPSYRYILLYSKTAVLLAATYPNLFSPFFVGEELLCRSTGKDGREIRKEFIKIARQQYSCKLVIIDNLPLASKKTESEQDRIMESIGCAAFGTRYIYE